MPAKLGTRLSPHQPGLGSSKFTLSSLMSALSSAGSRTALQSGASPPSSHLAKQQAADAVGEKIKVCLLIKFAPCMCAETAWCHGAPLRFGSAAKVLAKCKLVHYRLSECGGLGPRCWPRPPLGKQRPHCVATATLCMLTISFKLHQLQELGTSRTVDSTAQLLGLLKAEAERYSGRKWQAPVSVRRFGLSVQDV